MAAIGVILGLSITYFREVQNEKLNISTDFRSKAANLARHLHPAFFKKLEAGAPGVREEITTFLDSLNFSGSSSAPKSEITIYCKADQLFGPEEICTTQSDSFDSKGINSIAELLLDATAVERDHGVKFSSNYVFSLSPSPGSGKLPPHSVSRHKSVS